MTFPFKIPGYGEIVNEDAFELFKEHYLHSMKTLHNLRVAANKPAYKENIVIFIKGGAIQDIAADHPYELLVTVIDDDNIKAGDVIIHQGDWQVSRINKKIDEFIEENTDQKIFFFLSNHDSYSLVE